MVGKTTHLKTKIALGDFTPNERRRSKDHAVDCRPPVEPVVCTAPNRSYNRLPLKEGMNFMTASYALPPVNGRDKYHDLLYPDFQYSSFSAHIKTTVSMVVALVFLSPVELGLFTSKDTMTIITTGRAGGIH